MRLGLKQLGAGAGILALLVAGLAGGALASRTGDAGAAPCGPGGALDVIGLTSDQRLDRRSILPTAGKSGRDPYQTSVCLVDCVPPVKATTAIGAARKDQILERAAELFSRRGYHATTMRDLGEKSGLLPGSLYAHFSGKEEILYQIVIDAARQFLGGMEALSAVGAPPEEKFRRAMRAHIEVVANDLEGARVFLHEWTALRGRRSAEIRRLRRRYEELWDEIIRDVEPADPKLARLLVLSAANWTYVWYDPNGALGPEQIADRFSDLLLGGLRR